MIEVSIRRGWKAIVLDMIVFASKQPASWGLQLTSARRHKGLLLIDGAFDRNNPTAYESFRSWRRAARFRSQWTCECCGQPGRIRVGRYRSRVFCEQHAYLCGELLPNYDGIVYEIDHVPFSSAYDDLEFERWEIIKMWSDGRAKMADVCDWLGTDRADVYYSAHKLGLGIPVVEREDDAATSEEIVRLLGGRPDGTKH